MTNRSIVVLLLLWILAFPAFAVTVNLYEVEVPVVSQTADARTEASRVGFEQILVKLTGDPGIMNVPVIKENLDKAGYFVQEYRYAQPSPNSSEYQIYIRFNADDVNRLLNQSGVTYWGANRPLVLIYLTIKKANGELEVIGDDQSNSIANQIKGYSNKYGVPLILPVMDMEDINQFNADDISGMLMPALRTAGKRYAPDAYLVGNIQQNFGGYDSQWQLVSNTSAKQWNWTVLDRSVDKIIANVMDQVTQDLSNRHIVKHDPTPEVKPVEQPSQPQIAPADIWIRLEVSHIGSRRDLHRLMRYLRRLDSIQEVQLSQVGYGSVKIAVLVRGTVDMFRQNVELGRHLILKGEYSGANILLYEWVR